MRLIDIDAFLAENCIERISANDGLDWGCDDCQKCNARYLEVSCDRLLKFPTIDPVKRGKWVKNEGRYGWHCSACGEDDVYAFVWNCDKGEYELQDHYCPNCGARMDEATE